MRRITRVRTVNAPRNENGCPNFHCKLGKCMCDVVIRLNAPRNYVPFQKGHNRGMIGKQLDSPEFKNSPSVDEFCKTIDDYIAGNIEYKDLYRMYERIPRIA